jgi:LuxR family maltose regulon positive regulatory protein
LNGGLHRKLTLISAPAGYGKTTIASEWVENIEKDQVKESQIAEWIAWLSLDEGDNDLIRFLTYFVTALEQVEGLDANIGKAALSMLQSPQPPSTETILSSLINEITTIPGKIILVLDDYHLMKVQPIHDALAYLIEHLPPQAQLVIVSREDPPLPLTRLRAGDQLTEIRATDLRFTPSEAAEFFNKVMKLNLSSEDVRKLEMRTEGWIAGLQLAAISLQGCEDTTSFISSFTGSHHLILDYLIEEVLECQSPNVQTFLLSTAVLNRLTAPLCNAVSDLAESQEILEALDKANIFIISLDNERNWYRYHHLFQELLRQQLDRTDPDKGKELHRRAALWWDENGFVDEAIEHALFSGDPEWAASMLESHIDELWHSGKGIVVWRWIRRLPTNVVDSKPMLCIMRGYFLHGSGELEAAEISLQQAEDIIEHEINKPVKEAQQSGLKSSTDFAMLKGKLAVIRAFSHSFWGNVQETLKNVYEALEYLPKEELDWRSLAAIVLGEAHAFIPDSAAAFKAQSEAVEACKISGNLYFALIESGKLALTLKEQGRLQEALKVSQEQPRVAEELGLTESALAGYLYLTLGEILAETGNITEAIENVKTGLILDERSNYLPVWRCWGYFSYMRVLLSCSNIPEIEETIKKLRVIIMKSRVPDWVSWQTDIWQTRVWLAQGRLDQAALWLEGRELDVDCDSNEYGLFCLQEGIVISRVLIAQCRFEEANKLLNRLQEFAQKNGLVAREIEILALSALIYQAKGNLPKALSLLECALALAEPGSFIRIFVDEGSSMARLLYEALSREIATDYVRRLLAAFTIPEPEQAVPKESRVHESDFIEPLSERELEVLQLIADGLTNQEIASRLFLSLNTVKVHTRNIYGKLGVNNRTQAVTRVRGLGILPSSQ